MKSIVLTYNLKGTKKGRKITMLLGSIGYRVKAVVPEEYPFPVGVTAGILTEEEGKKETEKEKEAEETESAEDGTEEKKLDQEMLVFLPASQAVFDRALFMLRKEKVPVDLKAVLTQTNQYWDSYKLYHEIKKEHDYYRLNNKAKGSE